MSDSFDPYYTWLGIPPEEQPPDYYRLLAVRRFENNPEVIANALRQRESHLRSFMASPHGEVAGRMLEELAQAGQCLLLADQKGTYDRELRNKDAPRLTPNSGRKLTRPDAPRRGSRNSPEGGDSATEPAFGRTAATELTGALPVTTVRQGELIPVDAVVHVPVVYATRARSAAQPDSNRLMLFAVVGGLAFAAVLVVGICLAIGAYMLTAQLAKSPGQPAAAGPDESPPTREPTKTASPPPKAKPTVTRIVQIPQAAAANAALSSGRPGDLKLVVGDPSDPLAKFDPQRDVSGPGCMLPDGPGWTPREGEVYAAMFFPAAVPQEYVLETTLTLQSKSGGIIQGLVAGGKQCQITVDGFDGERDGKGMRTALEIIDGKRPHDVPDYPCQKFGKLLAPGRPVMMRYIVLKDRIIVESNGQVVLDWTGGVDRVSPNGMFARGPQQSLFWGTWQTKCRLSNVSLKPIVSVYE